MSSDRDMLAIRVRELESRERETALRRDQMHAGSADTPKPVALSGPAKPRTAIPKHEARPVSSWDCGGAQERLQSGGDGIDNPGGAWISSWRKLENPRKGIPQEAMGME